MHFDSAGSGMVINLEPNKIQSTAPQVLFYTFHSPAAKCQFKLQPQATPPFPQSLGRVTPHASKCIASDVGEKAN
jgi:hypothetical protein